MTYGFCQSRQLSAGIVRSLITDVWVASGGAWRLRVRHAGPVVASTNLTGQYGFVPQPAPRCKIDSELSFVAPPATHRRRPGLAAEMIHPRDRSTTRMQASLVSSEADGVARARSADVQARHAVDLRDALAIFGRAAYTRDRFAGIDSRTSAALVFSVRKLPPAR